MSKWIMRIVVFLFVSYVVVGANYEMTGQLHGPNTETAQRLFPNG